jgi:hypothetical protein
MPIQPAKPLSVGRAVSCALVNLLATPGLGSLIGRRMFAGTCQLALALAGFVMIVAWFVAVLVQFYGQINGDVEPKSSAWLAEAGAVTFGVAWLWSLVTSLSLVRQAKREAQISEGNLPPVITQPPPANPGVPS